MKLGKYSFGVGDRFSHEGVNQLKALIRAESLYGVHFVPVWNKSNREHTIISSEPMTTRREADEAVKALGYTGEYHCDADHINLTNVDRFMDACDFFTLDVADYIGREASPEEIEAFLAKNGRFIGTFSLPGIDEPFTVTRADAEAIARKYLFAVKEAGRIYRHIAERKGADNFVTEVSMDEVSEAQSPVEVLFILSALAEEKVPAQTFAPKFTGRFNKGVDYVGDIAAFEREFESDLLVIAYAVKEFGLPENLKLSIHSGSDKFSIYPIMGRLIRKHGAGIHIKTAGTTWLEEIIGLALADAEALALAKRIYRSALERMDELTVPYASVIDVDRSALPTPETVDAWDADTFARTLRHDQSEKLYNPSFRQLMHVSFKVAAELSGEYRGALEKHIDVIGREIEANICDRHVRRLFA